MGAGKVAQESPRGNSGMAKDGRRPLHIHEPLMRTAGAASGTAIHMRRTPQFNAS